MCDSVKFGTPLPAVVSPALNYSLTEYASSYMPERKTLNRTYSVGDQVPTCPVFTRAKIKSRFGIFDNFASQYRLGKEKSNMDKEELGNRCIF